MFSGNKACAALCPTERAKVIISSKINLSKLDPETVTPFGIFKLIQSTNKLIIKPTNPKLKKFKGSVNNFKTYPKVKFKIVKIITKNSAEEKEATLKPGKTALSANITTTLTKRKIKLRNITSSNS